MAGPGNGTHTARGGRFGKANAGTPGVNLQNAPVLNGQQQQSYVMGVMGARLPKRPIMTPMEGFGTPVEYQAGQPGIQTWDTRQRARNPMYGVWNDPGWVDTGNAKLPGDPAGDPQGKVGILRHTQESNGRPGDGLANDKLVTRDRHVFLKVGHENSGRDSGQTDPPLDGPPRPSLASINRTINWQQGTVYQNPVNKPLNATNGNVDDLSRNYTREPNLGMFVGEQGSGWSSVYGGVPGMWQPYGSYAGITGGPVKGIQSPVAQGAQGDGPRKVWSGPPHGLHSPTLPDYLPTVGFYMAQPAPRAPRMDHPDNSTSSGQSYSQLVQPQGQTGTVMARPANMTATPNVWNKLHYTPGNGWRGQVG